MEIGKLLHGAIFYFLTAVTLGSAVVVARARNLVYSAVALLFTFFGIAGLFVYAHADFVAGIQAVVYIGGILVLILFGIMLTRREGGVKVPNEVTGSTGARLIPIGVTVLLLLVVLSVDWEKRYTEQERKHRNPQLWSRYDSDAPESVRSGTTGTTTETTENADKKKKSSGNSKGASGDSSGDSTTSGTIDTIGQSMMNKYLVAFEEISVLLLVALLGAVYLARRPTEEELEEAKKAHDELENEVYGT